MLHEDHYASKELKHRKKYLDMICKSFADYLERKRTMIMTSVKFHKNAIEVLAKSYCLIQSLPFCFIHLFYMFCSFLLLLFSLKV